MYNITLEEPDGKETGPGEQPGIHGEGQEQEVHRPHPQEAGLEGRPGEQPGTLGEGQEREGSPAQRARADEDSPMRRVGHHIGMLAMRGQEDEDRAAGTMSHQ